MIYYTVSSDKMPFVLICTDSLKNTKVTFQLTPTEAILLRTLLLNANKVFTREDLLKCIDKKNDERTIDKHMSSIRLRMRAQGFKNFPIKTISGLGYMYGELAKYVPATHSALLEARHA